MARPIAFSGSPAAAMAQKLAEKSKAATGTAGARNVRIMITVSGVAPQTERPTNLDPDLLIRKDGAPMVCR